MSNISDELQTNVEIFSVVFLIISFIVPLKIISPFSSINILLLYNSTSSIIWVEINVILFSPREER